MVSKAKTEKLARIRRREALRAERAKKAAARIEAAAKKAERHAANPQRPLLQINGPSGEEIILSRVRLTGYSSLSAPALFMIR